MMIQKYLLTFVLVFSIFISGLTLYPNKSDALVDGFFEKINSMENFQSSIPHIVIDSNDTVNLSFPSSLDGNSNATTYTGGLTWDTYYSCSSVALANLGTFELKTRVAFDSLGNKYISCYKNDGSIHIGKYTVGEDFFPAISGTAGYHQLVFDSNNVPYVVYRGVYADSWGAIVKKLDDGNWVTVGNINFSSGEVKNLSMVFDSDNNPYVSYVKNSGGIAEVKKFNGISWESVGSLGSVFNGGYLSMDIDSSNVLYVSYSDNTGLIVKKFNGTSWENVGDYPFIGVGTNSFISVDSDNSLYVSYINSSGFNLKKFNGTSWVNLSDPYYSSSEIYNYQLAPFDIDSNGIVYATYISNPSGDKEIIVLKFNTDPTIYSYSGNFVERYGTSGGVSGSRVASISGDIFVNAGSTLTEGQHYSLANKPEGLTSVMTVDSSGETATLTFTGSTVNNLDENDISNLTITFLDGAFVDTAVANNVINYTNSNGIINFSDTTYTFNGTTTLYGSDGAGNNHGTINLYTLDPSNGDILTTIGSLDNNINGMAFHPGTGVLYGVTSNGDYTGSAPYTLFTINPENGELTTLGLTREGLTNNIGFPDIAFREDGTLYGRSGWENNGYYLYTIDITCPGGVCEAVKVGNTSIGTGQGGAIAFDSNDNLYIFEAEEDGFFKINPDDGSIIETKSYSNISSEGRRVMTSAKFDGNGILFASRSNSGLIPSDLVTINVETGEITSTGDNNPVMPFMTALAFKLEEVVITTPTLTTSPSTSINTTSAILNGEVVGNGGEEPTEVGFEYGLTGAYGTSVESIDYDSRTFSYNLTDLVCNTTYHFKAYATNSAGTGEGSDATFTTSSCPLHGSRVIGSSRAVIAQIQNPQSNNIIEQTLTNPNPTITVLNIKRILKLNITGDDVKELQIWLNNHGHPVSLIGPGSKGHETNKFGPLTKKAVILFQKANGLTPDGIVGPKTREKMK